MACLLLTAFSTACSLLLLVPMSLLTSCKQTTQTVPLGEQDLPEMELYDADYTLAKDDAAISSDNPMILHADVITIYGSNKDSVLQNVTFWQGTSQGTSQEKGPTLEHDSTTQGAAQSMAKTEDYLSGSCKNATVAPDNNSATLSGDVIVKQVVDGEEITIETQEAKWDGTENTLTCEGLVKITYSDGTKILAEGLFAAIDDNVYTFSKILEGHLE